MPWYGDHANKSNIRQESYIRECLVPYMEKHFPTYEEKEGRLLLGFSKSGWGHSVCF